MAEDADIIEITQNIQNLVDQNAEECGKLFELFKEYDFLWTQDVNQTFKHFLQGKTTPNPLRSASHSNAEHLRRLASAKSHQSSK